MNAYPSPRRHSAFTLIELLVVLFIIGILMALLFPAIKSAIEQGRRADAGVATQGIVTAVNGYINDYGKFAEIKSSLTESTGNSHYSFGDVSKGLCKDTNEKLFNVLRAIDKGENSSHELNPRKVSYISPKAAKDPRNPRNGIIDGKEFPEDLKGRYMDPWGAQYCVVIDADGDEKIGMQEFYQDQSNAEADQIRKTVVVFSMGVDGERGGKNYLGKLRNNSTSAPEDVISW